MPGTTRIPARARDLIGVVIAIAIVLVAYHQVAFGGKTFDTSSLTTGVNGADPPTGVSPADVHDVFRIDPAASAWVSRPWAWVVHQELAHGKWPLWNPYQATGSPLAANAQSAAFDPLMMAVNLHPTPLTWDLSFLFVFMLGAAATYLFLRALGIGFLGAIVGAATFTLSGYFPLVNNNSYVRIYAYLPILLLGIDRVIRTSRFRWVAFVAVATAGSILAGMPESTYLVLFAAGAYALYRVTKSPRVDWPGAALRLGGGLLLGVGLASPLILLFLQYLPLSSNSHGPGVGDRTGATATLLYWLVPYLNRYHGMPRVPALRGDLGWCGTAAAALAVVAASATSLMRRFGGWFFLVFGAVVLLKNHNVRGFQWIGKLPAFNRIDSTGYAPPLAAVCLAVAGGIGIHALATGTVRRRWLLAGLGASGVVLALLFVANRPVLAVAHDAFALRNLALAAAAGATVVVAAWIACGRRADHRLRSIAAGSAAAALLVEMFVLFPQGIYAPRSDPFRAPPWLALVRAQGAAEPEARVFGLDRKLYPDTAGVFGLQDARALDALYISRFVTYIRTFVTHAFSDRFTGDESTTSQIVGNPMFDLLGVRFVLTSSAETDARNGLLQAASTGQYASRGTAGGVQVFENSHRVPRAFVASDLHEVGGADQAVAYLKSLGHPTQDGGTRVDRFDPSRQAVVETPPGKLVAVRAPDVLPPQARPATIVAYASDRVEIDVPAGAPGLLVLTDSYYPGWRAAVNGRPVPVLATDVVFRGVLLGGGACRVVFRYDPPGHNLLWGIPMLVALALAAIGVVSWWRRWSVSAGRAQPANLGD